MGKRPVPGHYLITQRGGIMEGSEKRRGKRGERRGSSWKVPWNQKREQGRGRRLNEQKEVRPGKFGPLGQAGRKKKKGLFTLQELWCRKKGLQEPPSIQAGFSKTRDDYGKNKRTKKGGRSEKERSTFGQRAAGEPEKGKGGKRGGGGGFAKGQIWYCIKKSVWFPADGRLKKPEVRQRTGGRGKARKIIRGGGTQRFLTTK